MDVRGRFARPGPSLRSVVRAIIDAVSGFSSVSCLETWRIPVPRIQDRLHRIEPCSPNSHPGVRPEGLSLALPMVAPEDTFAAVGVHPAPGPSDTLVGARPAHWPVPHVCGMVPVELAAASPRAGLPLQAGWPLPPDAASQDVTDVAPGSRCVSHRAVLWLICRPVGSPPLHSSSP